MRSALTAVWLLCAAADGFPQPDSECLAKQREWMLSGAHIQQMDDPRGYNSLAGFELEIRNAIVSAIKEPGSSYRKPIFVDAGANMGQELPTWAALSKKTGGSIVMIEPHWRTHRELMRTIRKARKNDKSLRRAIRVYNVALGNESKMVTFWGNFGKRSRAMKGAVDLPENSLHASLARTRASSKSIQVSMHRLDHLLKEDVNKGRRVALLKSDCQGWDHWVLQGATGILRSVDGVVLEYDAMLWNLSGARFLDTVRLLHEYGFAVFALALPSLLALDPSRMAWQEAFRPANSTQMNWMPMWKPGHTKTTFNLIGLRREGPLACPLINWARRAAVHSSCAPHFKEMTAGACD
eukprot:TRINITY_DN21567_c0_g1_i1.p1 TRINITY_DN21567_c0_g1~~TRINITY_DN21567_c0_g1_i1.p1  ORF type:complete len:352 (+),score=103.17 TRINITY_DN21567_c0_g1_i1:47-1102(+)